MGLAAFRLRPLRGGICRHFGNQSFGLFDLPVYLRTMVVIPSKSGVYVRQSDVRMLTNDFIWRKPLFCPDDDILNSDSRSRDSGFAAACSRRGVDVFRNCIRHLDGPRGTKFWK
jgi:hypothetical protein